MFLTCIYSVLNIVGCIFQFIENNSVLVGIISSMLVSSLWLRKFMKQKRAEAFFGFYARFSLRLRALQTRLEENGRLNISKSEAGNIYTLIYAEDYISDVCPEFISLRSEELKLYKDVAAELKKILLETENNVYPPGSKREEWYESQHILFSFCEFIENDEYQHTTNEQFAQGKSEPKHITKCKSLIGAINYIQESINRAKY